VGNWKNDDLFHSSRKSTQKKLDYRCCTIVHFLVKKLVSIIDGKYIDIFFLLNDQWVWIRLLSRSSLVYVDKWRPNCRNRMGFEIIKQNR
jgi:hypothetical protein